MYNRLKRLYDNGEINENGLRKAVEKGWITPDEYKEITGNDY